MCAIRTRLIPGVGYEIEGSCGERLDLGVSEVLEPRRVPPSACEDFRTRMLSVFGRGGRRVFEGDDREEAYDGLSGLGKRPGSRVEDRELAALFTLRPT